MGLRQARYLEQRCCALQDSLLLLRLLRVRTENGHGLWMGELAAVSADGQFSALRFPDSLDQACDLRQALQGYLQASGAAQLLDKAAYGWLLAALECAVTRQETAARLDYYCQLLSQALQTARSRQAQDQKLYLQLGPLAGALLAVILW